jgi:hypothetical protein
MIAVGMVQPAVHEIVEMVTHAAPLHADLATGLVTD